MVNDALRYVIEHPGEFWLALKVHLTLSALALLIAVVVCVPLGIYISKHSRASFVVVNTFSLGRIIPSIAVLAMAMPYLGLGFKPALIALVLLAFPPVLLNTYSGFKNIDPAVIEAAYGMGMEPRQVMRRIEFPLALPVIIVGIKTAAVEVVASATLASVIGGGGLGDFIIAGINMADDSRLLVGAVPVAVMALLVDCLFSLIEKKVIPPQ